MKKVNNQEKNEPTLLSVYDDDLRRLAQRVGKDRSVNSLKALRQGRSYVAAFLLERLGADDVPLNRLTPQTIHDFSVWLSAERGLRGGTVWLASMQLKGVVTRAHQQGLLSWNPFAGFRIAKNIRPREYLSEEEILRLKHHDFQKPPLRKARDIFLLACLTGLSFVDIQQLQLSSIRVINGSRWIMACRQKTKVPFQVRLMPAALYIIKRYAREDSDSVFSDVQYRTLAKQLKQVMAEVGITKRISMHCGRHSFAVMALNHGMPIESVSRVLGHTNITTTQIYAKITMGKLDTDFSTLSDHLPTDFTTPDTPDI